MNIDGQDWKKLSIEKKIGSQIKAWSEKKEKTGTFITISREFGAEGWVLGQKIEEILNKSGSHFPPWVACNKELLAKVEKDEHLTSELVESLEKPAQNAISEFFDSHFANRPPRIAIFKKTAKVIKTLASQGHVIIVGRGGCFLTQGMKHGFHVRFVAPMDWKVKNIVVQQNLSEVESEILIKKMDKDRDAFIHDYFFTDVSNPHYYDLVINTSRFDLNDAAELVLVAMKKRGLI